MHVCTGLAANSERMPWDSAQFLQHPTQPAFALQQHVGEDALHRMKITAQNHKLPSPLDMANRWADKLNIASAAVRQRASPAAAATAASGGVRAGMRNSPAAGGPALPPAAPPPRGAGSGFLKVAAGAPPEAAATARNGGNAAAAPPAAALPGAADPEEAALRQRKLLDLSYEDYLNVFGRVEEEWFQRKWQESLMRESKGKLGDENAYVKECRQKGARASEAALRQEFRNMLTAHAQRESNRIWRGL